MTVKTITVTEDAYESLKGLRKENESFSEIILRVTKKKSIWDFAGLLSEENASKIEHEIKNMRKKHLTTHKARIDGIVRRLEGENDNS